MYELDSELVGKEPLGTAPKQQLGSLAPPRFFVFLLPAHDRRLYREVCRGLRRAVVGMLSPGLIT